MTKNLVPIAACLLLALNMPLARAVSSREVNEAVVNYLQQITRNLPGTVQVSAKPLDERQLTLARCAQVQAFLPQGQKAWGRVTVGVRCVNGPNASLYVGAQVKVEGSYVKLARPVPGGQALEAGDLQLEQGELTAHPADIVLDLNEAAGQVTRQALSAGQPLRSSYLQHEVGIQAGQSVQVIAHGGGFSVMNRGRALNTAARGAQARVKLDNGQIVSGVAGSGIVDVGSTQ